MQSIRVGKYRIIAKLGQGGMATVFLSVVPGPAGFNKLLVVKILKEDLAHDSDFLGMFLNEARLAARLNHPNVVQTYEVGLEDGQHFLAMDYLDGQPLHSILRRATRAKMPLDIHVRIIADALAGLHYAHTLRDFDGTPLSVVHRDVSPQNVFITYDGQVKLVDFGIAKAAGAATTTQSGVFKGKLSYVAPEQAGFEAVDARADLFSVGVMLWEAMAAQRFAQGDAQTAIMARRLSGTEPRIRDVVPDADAELAEICDRAMAHRPADRYQTADAFRSALENFLDRFSRRVGSREVGEYLTALFHEEREKIREIIDQQMKLLMRETSQSLTVPSLDMHHTGTDATPITTREIMKQAQRAMQAHGHVSAAPLSQPGALDAPSAHDSGPGSASGAHGTLVAANISQHPPGSRSSRTVLYVLGGLAVASLIGIAVVLSLPAPTKPAATPAEPAKSSANAEASDKIKVSISYGPAGVTAKLDGVTLGENPFTAQVARDGSLHRIEVSGPGLLPETRMVSFEKDLTLTFTLLPEPVSSASVSASAGPSPGFRPGALPKGTNQPRTIDEDDPYKKEMNGRALTFVLLSSFAALSLAVHAIFPTVAEAQQGSDEASQRFRAGVAFYKTKDYPAALVEFKRAYELAPNYRVLYNLGQTSQQLNFYADALTAFQQYLAEGGKEIDASRKVSVESAIVELKTKVGTITIETNAEGAEISIDDLPAGIAPLDKPLIVNAGRRKFSATAKGYLPVTRVIEVAGSDSSTVKLELTKIEQDPPPRDPEDPKPKPPPERTIPVSAWVMLGVTGAAGVATGVMGGLALSARSELDDALGTLPGDKTVIADAQNKTQTFAITTDVLIGVTVAAAATTVILFAVDFGPSEPEAEAPKASLHVTPGGLTFSGSF